MEGLGSAHRLPELEIGDDIGAVGVSAPCVQTGKLILGTSDPPRALPLTWHVISSRGEQARSAMDGADLVIAVNGNEPHVHGRETEDRPSLALSGPDRPDILDYDVISSGATYLYGQTAQFAFGRGLTLIPTQWIHPSLEADEHEIRASVTLARDGTLPAHEVVQVYAPADSTSYVGV